MRADIFELPKCAKKLRSNIIPKVIAFCFYGRFHIAKERGRIIYFPAKCIDVI